MAGCASNQKPHSMSVSYPARVVTVDERTAESMTAVGDGVTSAGFTRT